MTCDKCGRAVYPWILKRGAVCSPKDWAHCIRNDGAYRFAPPIEKAKP